MNLLVARNRKKEAESSKFAWEERGKTVTGTRERAAGEGAS